LKNITQLTSSSVRWSATHTVRNIVLDSLHPNSPSVASIALASVILSLRSRPH